MTTLYLVRHGETLFNQRQLVQGWVDSPLTAEGWHQARRAADQLRPRAIVAVYSSTSERAFDTAEVIANHHPGVKVHGRRGLKEFHFGELEAIPSAEIAERVDIPSFFGAVIAGQAVSLPGGETGEQYRRRVDGVLQEILQAHPEGEVVVVSHGVTINAMLLTAGWHNRGPVPNASISILQTQPTGPARVVAVGLLQLPAQLGSSAAGSALATPATDHNQAADHTGRSARQVG